MTEIIDAICEEVVIIVTEDEHREELAWGLSEDEVLPVGVHTFHRGGFLQRHGLDANHVNRLTAPRLETLASSISWQRKTICPK